MRLVPRHLLPPSVPLFVRASPNRNSFRPEVSVAHELRRYVVSPASPSLPLPLLLPRPIQLPGIRPRSPPPPGVAPSFSPPYSSSKDQQSSSRPTATTGDGSARREGRKNRGMSGRTNRVIALVLTAVVQEATVVVIRVGRARERDCFLLRSANSFLVFLKHPPCPHSLLCLTKYDLAFLAMLLMAAFSHSAPVAKATT